MTEQEHKAIGLGSLADWIARQEAKKQAAEKRRQEHREWEQSLRLDNNLPKLTPEQIVSSVQNKRSLWRPLGTAEREKAEAEAREIEARREIGELIPIPEVEI